MDSHEEIINDLAEFIEQSLKDPILPTFVDVLGFLHERGSHPQHACYIARNAVEKVIKTLDLLPNYDAVIYGSPLFLYKLADQKEFLVDKDRIYHRRIITKKGEYYVEPVSDEDPHLPFIISSLAGTFSLNVPHYLYIRTPKHLRKIADINTRYCYIIQSVGEFTPFNPDNIENPVGFWKSISGILPLARFGGLQGVSGESDNIMFLRSSKLTRDNVIGRYIMQAPNGKYFLVKIQPGLPVEDLHTEPSEFDREILLNIRKLLNLNGLPSSTLFKYFDRTEVGLYDMRTAVKLIYWDE